MQRLLLTVLALALISVRAEAQQGKPAIHPTRDACDNAVKAGNFSTYEAQNFGLVGRNPVPGSAVDSVRVEQPGCFLLLTFRGYQWVSLGAGTMMLTCDGMICGLASCWNPSREHFFPVSSLSTDPPPPFGAVRPRADTLHVVHSGRVEVSVRLIPPPTAADTSWLPPARGSATDVPFTVRKRGGGLPAWAEVLIAGVVVVGSYYTINALTKGGDSEERPGVITFPPGAGVEIRPRGGG
jgi:hypothetical protein